MAEAIFAKYGGGSSIPAELKISDYTKFALGLNTNATLDDCLRKINSIDVNTGLAIITLKDVDGAPLGDHNIRITDAGGLNVVYTTDGTGQCSFKTINGVANFYDESNLGWFDLVHQNALNVNIPIGSVQQITLQRQKKYNNGDTISLSSSQYCNFSKFADKTDVEIKSGDGGIGFSGLSIRLAGYVNMTYSPNINISFNMVNNQFIEIWSNITQYSNRYIRVVQHLNQAFTASRGGNRGYNRINNVNIKNCNIWAKIYHPEVNEVQTNLSVFTGNNNTDKLSNGMSYALPYNANYNNTNYIQRYEVQNDSYYQVFFATLNHSSYINTTGSTTFGNILSVSGGHSSAIESKSCLMDIETWITPRNIAIMNNGSLSFYRGIMNNIHVCIKPRSYPVFTLNSASINLINFQYK